MTYHDQLNPWTVQQLQPNAEQKVIARFRRRAEADSYRNAMQQMRPGSRFLVAFATETPDKTNTPVSP